MVSVFLKESLDLELRASCRQDEELVLSIRGKIGHRPTTTKTNIIFLVLTLKDLYFIIHNFSLSWLTPTLSPCLHRWTDRWPWKRRESRHATGKCPTSPKRTSAAARVTRNSLKAFTTRPLPSAPPLWPDTCPWATCRLSATLDICCPHPPRYTPHSGTRTTLTWWRLWAERGKDVGTLGNLRRLREEGLTRGRCVQCYRHTVCGVFIFNNLLNDWLIMPNRML